MGPKTTKRDPGGAAAPLDLRALEDPRAHGRLRLFVRAVLIGEGAPATELDDLVAEVVKDAAADRHQYNPALATVETWLASIARHRLADFRRRWRAKESRLVPEEAITAAAEPAAPDLNPEQAVHARRLLRALDAAVQGPSRDSFLLHAEGHCREVIARETGVQPGAVKHRLEQAAELRDQALIRMGEQRKDGAHVRFGALPLLLAFFRRTETPAPPPEAGESLSPARQGIGSGQISMPPRALFSRFLGAAAWAVATAAAIPVASGVSPEDGSARPRPHPRAAAIEPARSPAPGIATEHAPTPWQVPAAPRAPAAPSGGRSRSAPPSSRHAPLAASPAAVPGVASRPAPPDDTDVLLRLAAAAGRAGSNGEAAALLEQHARQFPSARPDMLAGLAGRLGGKGPAPR
jgi:DNA-directed RNA polymerase specialized sigma24 family protein